MAAAADQLALEQRAVAGERAGVGERLARARVAAADLDGEHRDAALGRAVEPAAEGVEVADGLDEQPDRAQVAAGQVLEALAHADVELVAGADQPVEPDAGLRAGARRARRRRRRCA